MAGALQAIHRLQLHELPEPVKQLTKLHLRETLAKRAGKDTLVGINFHLFRGTVYDALLTPQPVWQT